MNERILKLAEQAISNVRFWKEEKDSYVVDQDELAKFAELIVKECIRVARNNTPDTEECEYTHLVSDAIRQHFGVEE